MQDFEPFFCCDKNKEKRAVVFRDYVRKKPKGFYLHCIYSSNEEKWTQVQFCPFCGKNLNKLASLL